MYRQESSPGKSDQSADVSKAGACGGKRFLPPSKQITFGRIQTTCGTQLNIIVLRVLPTYAMICKAFMLTRKRAKERASHSQSLETFNPSLASGMKRRKHCQVHLFEKAERFFRLMPEAGKAALRVAMEVARRAKLVGMMNAKLEQADAMDEAGRWQEVEELWRQLLGDSETLFGRDNECTLGAMCQLANVLYHQDKWQEADLVHREALKRMRSRLGEDHPDTICKMNNLANVLQEQGKGGKRRSNCIERGFEGQAVTPWKGPSLHPPQHEQLGRRPGGVRPERRMGKTQSTRPGLVKVR